MLEEDLTPGEKLIIWKTRNRFPYKEAAQHFGVTIKAYKEWERNENDPPNIDLQGLEIYEHFHILRHRSGMSRVQLGRIIGFNPMGIRKMETGIRPIYALVAYWTGAKIKTKRQGSKSRTYE